MKKINLFTNATYEMVAVQNLKIDAYQRVLNISFAKEIAKEFDMNRIGTITVSYRNGVFNVIDGQTRSYAARLVKVQNLMCQVFHGMTYEQEAIEFKRLNKDRKGILAFDYFNAEIEAKDKEALNVKRIVEENGIGITRSNGNNKIQAITALKNIYRKYGDKHLNDTLQFVKSAWDGVPDSMTRNIIMGVSEFISIYKDDIKIEVFSRQLKRVDPVKIVREAENDSAPISKVIKMVNIIFKYYNLKLGKNRLENKHFNF